MLTDPAQVQQDFIKFFQDLLGAKASEMPCLDSTIAKDGYYINKEDQQGDLIMCCRADQMSIQLMLKAFEHFSTVSGLKANMEKSSLYITGVEQQLKDQILYEMHFSLGMIPFKYLGVPLSSKKITVQQCMPLVERMWQSAVNQECLVRDSNVLITSRFDTKKGNPTDNRKFFDARKWYGHSDLYTDMQQFTQAYKFIIKKAYLHLIPQYPKVAWKSLNMRPCHVPKYQFILWLTLQKRLTTADRLAKWGIQVLRNCVLCVSDAEETHSHLFFECEYSRQLWSSFLRRIGENSQVGSWEEEVERITTKKCSSKAHAEVLGWLLAASVYHIWNERNARRFQEQQQDQRLRSREIVIQLHSKGQHRSRWKRILKNANSYPNLVQL
ncbi:PREDICTED: uncharacterized protein LOC109213078 [Nicotiana attenuata]|uniref:uncharacterized protein LOC109213078 n=1 Tax=Nicotiana attenuata TaxID=49451 RepID=UPI000904883D|nr:PREDICTED: uncharacterized protein LOC109213078 [Nicotiana attenuata]